MSCSLPSCFSNLISLSNRHVHMHWFLFSSVFPLRPEVRRSIQSFFHCLLQPVSPAVCHHPVPVFTVHFLLVYSFQSDSLSPNPAESLNLVTDLWTENKREKNTLLSLSKICLSHDGSELQLEKLHGSVQRQVPLPVHLLEMQLSAQLLCGRKTS